MKMKKKYFSIAGIVAGAYSIIMSLQVNGAETGYWESSVTYGGDAYTGIQNAAAQSANNIIYLGDMIQTGVVGLLFVLGVACIAFFGKQLLIDLEEEKKMKEEMPEIAVSEKPVEKIEENLEVEAKESESAE